MNAPLSRFLVEFAGEVTSPEPVEIDDIEPLEAEPGVTLTLRAFEEHMSDARAQAAAAARAEAETELQARFEGDLADLLSGFEAEREVWARDQGESLSTSLTAAIARLEAELAAAAAAALRPLFVEACRSRILAELGATVASILGDPGHPPVRIEGPVDLLTAFGNAHAGDLAIDYVVSEQAELVVITDTTRITTRLTECLANFDANEG